MASGVTASAASFGNGLTALDYSGGNGLTGRNQTASDLAGALTGNDYLTFTLTPGSSKSLTVTALKLRPVSQNRERTFAVFSSVGGFTSGQQIATFTHNGGTNAAEKTVTITGVTNRTSAVEFRIYAYGATNQWEAVGLGQATGNDLVVEGSVADSGGTATAPAAPTGAAATTLSSSSVEFSFVDQSSNETAFELAYKRTSESTWIGVDNEPAATGTGTVLEVTFDGLDASVGYDFRARAVNGSLSSDWVSASATTQAATASGTLAAWDFSGTAGAATSTADSTAANLTVSTAALGNGLTALNYSGGNGLTGRNQTAADLAGALTGNDYLAFTLTPGSGKSLTVSALKLRPVSQNRERTFAVFSSVGGFASGQQIATFTHDGGTNAAEKTVTITGVGGRTSAVEFRIYVYGGTNQWESVGLGQATGNDLVVEGSVQ